MQKATNPIVSRIGRRAVGIIRRRYHGWVASRRDPEERWRGGIDDEIKFWRDWLETKGSQWPEEYEVRLNPAGQLLDDFVARFLPPDRPRIRILDVGSGPVSSLGFPRSPDGRTVELTAADPLADSYQKLLRRYGIMPPTWPIPLAVEELSNRFDDGVFDLVHARNASDHTVNPVVGIQQMVRVVRPGCYVVLQHYPNEAESEAYAGLHGWNLDEKDGRFIIWHRSSEIDNGHTLGSTADVSYGVMPAGFTPQLSVVNLLYSR